MISFPDAAILEWFAIRGGRSSSGLRMEEAQGAEGGRVAVVDADFFKDVLQMPFDRVFGGVEDAADLAVAFPLGNPEQHFGFPLR